VKFLPDAGMNVTTLVDTGGDALERYVYDPYGEVTIYDDDWSETRSTSSYDNNILFCGYYHDWETGLYHVRHRYYHVHLGAWLSRDPLGYVNGPSLYGYCGGNPVGLVDPLGLGAEDVPPGQPISPGDPAWTEKKCPGGGDENEPPPQEEPPWWEDIPGVPPIPEPIRRVIDADGMRDCITAYLTGDPSAVPDETREAFWAYVAAEQIRQEASLRWFFENRERLMRYERFGPILPLIGRYLDVYDNARYSGMPHDAAQSGAVLIFTADLVGLTRIWRGVGQPDPVTGRPHFNREAQAADLCLGLAQTALLADAMLPGGFASGLSGGASSNNMAVVSRWGRPGLESGDWVMKGGASRANYVLSGKWQPTWVYGKNIPASFSSGTEFVVQKGALTWPKGVLGTVKGVIGQRIYTGPGM
jgi:RHS repeat-associated protein